MPVECSEGLRDERPRVRVGRSFARDVAPVEFSDGRFEVIEVEYDSGYHHPGGVDFGDRQHFSVERVGPRVTDVVLHVAEAKATASQGERRLGDVRDAQVRDRTHIVDLCGAVGAQPAESLAPVIEQKIVGI